MDLSRAYDCISHKLLITKLGCYCLNEIRLKLILGYLSYHKQRNKKDHPSVLDLTSTLWSHKVQSLGFFFYI